MMTAVLTPQAPAAPRRQLTRAQRTLRSSEFTLACVALVGFVALTIATDGNMLSSATLAAFFRFLAVPMMIGLSQMVVLSIGQMNLSVGVLTGFCSMAAAWLMVEAGWPAPIAIVAALRARRRRRAGQRAARRLHPDQRVHRDAGDQHDHRRSALRHPRPGHVPGLLARGWCGSGARPCSGCRSCSSSPSWSRCSSGSSSPAPWPAGSCSPAAAARSRRACPASPTTARS